VKIACLYAGCVGNVGHRQFPRHRPCFNGLPRVYTATAVSVMSLSETYWNFGTTGEVEVVIGSFLLANVLGRINSTIR
jgi:hypothetical protein